MFWVALHGPDAQDVITSWEQVTIPFKSIHAAVVGGNKLAASQPFPFGKAQGYVVTDERKTIVYEGTF